jgi:hypothetical protein
MGRYDLVTFSFGGDDVGFASIMMACYEGSNLCTDKAVRAQIAAVANSYRTFLAKVATNAVVADGNVVVMGYPELIEDPGLWPVLNDATFQCQGLSRTQAKRIRGWAGDLNATIGNAVKTANALPPAKRNGVHFTFVDVVTGQAANGISSSDPYLFEPATGTRHELCSKGDSSWLNGLSKHIRTRSLHPDQLGENGMGNLAAEVIEHLDWSHFTVTAPAGFSCVPTSSNPGPQVAPGVAASISTQFGPYTAIYSGVGASEPGPTNLGVPGTLKVKTGSRVWTISVSVNTADVSQASFLSLGSLCLVRFGTEFQPEVLLEQNTAGAHCCYEPAIYSYSASSGGYELAENLGQQDVGASLHWDANTGITPVQEGDKVVLQSEDGAFPYQFGCYACTPAPVRLFSFENDSLVDVTAEYPNVVRTEADSFWQDMQSADPSSIEGSTAAWVADECQLGYGAQAWVQVQQLDASGKFAAAAAEPFSGATEPFVPALSAFLLKNGYCQGQIPS